MPEIVSPADLRQDEEICLEGDPFSALRWREPYRGEIITLKDASGQEFRGRIVELLPDRATVYVFEELREPTEPPLDVVVFQALPDKERMELIIQKVTELGVYSIVPFKSKRSISLEEREGKQQKAQRWQSIAIKAAQQSRRGRVPLLEHYCDFSEALGYAEGSDLKAILWERGNENPLRDVLRSQGNYAEVALMVGPEGGFDPEEVQRAKERGFIPNTDSGGWKHEQYGICQDRIQLISPG